LTPDSRSVATPILLLPRFAPAEGPGSRFSRRQHTVAGGRDELCVEGTTFQHEVGMLVADGETNFLRGCLLLARGGSFSARLATPARAKVRRDYSPVYSRERLADLVCGWTLDEEFDVGIGHSGARS